MQCFSDVCQDCEPGTTWFKLENGLRFLDDILILGHTFQEHLVNLAEALSRFTEQGLKLKPKKFLFFQGDVDFLGRRVSINCKAMSDIDIQMV